MIQDQYKTCKVINNIYKFDLLGIIIINIVWMILYLDDLNNLNKYLKSLVYSYHAILY